MADARPDDSIEAMADDAAAAVSDIKPSSYGATPLTAVFGVAVWYYAMWVLLQRLIFLGNYNQYLPASLQRLFPVPPIDAVYTGEHAPMVPAAIQNTLLILLFAVPYTIMSRKDYKQWATSQWYPQAIERSVLLLVSSATLHLQMRNWVPMTQTVLTLPSILGLAPLLGYLLIIAATLNIDHLSFFGLKQSIGISHTPHLVKSGVYRFMRHPLMVGELVTWWAYSHITRGRVLFALLNTAFLVLRAKVLEEPDLIMAFGDKYKEFMQKKPGFVPTVQRDEVVNPDKPVETIQNITKEVLGGTKLE